MSAHHHGRQRFGSCGAALGVAAAIWSGAAQAGCDVTLNAGADLGAAIANAAAGATLCLGDGRYAGITLNNVSKSAMVTVRSLNGAAAVNVGDLSLDRVSNVQLTGVTFTG